jgi:hypothetical protein
MDNAHTSLDKAGADLICGALFYGMRSCEYTKTPKSEERKTTLLELRDITFRDEDGNILSQKSKDLALRAHYVIIRFRNQKNGEKMESVVQRRSHKQLCPVSIWARICTRIRSYPGTTPRTTVNTVLLESCNTTVKLRSNYVITKLRAAVRAAGPKNLGIHISSVGTHSIRTSFAMMFALRNIADSKIMKKGRWKSDAFLRYIRNYVGQFGAECSSAIAHEDNNFKVF